jgi:hypothetical protein
MLRVSAAVPFDKRISSYIHLHLDMTKHAITPRRFIGFRIDVELLDGLQAVWKRDGVAVSEQVRRAIRMWLDAKGVKTERKRGSGSRTRS